MSDNAFVRLDGLKAALSRVKTKVDSDIASAISESTSSLTSAISSGDSSTLNSAKSYVDDIKTTLESNITSNLATAKGYTDGIKNALETNISNHTSDTNNPHSVTYSQTGAAASSHTHSESDITDLGNYSVAGHTHTVNDITDSNTLATNSNLTNHTSDTNNPHSVTYSQTGAAAASHTHTEADITDLGNYANASHTHTVSDITDANTVAAAVHSHTLSDITDVTATTTEVNTLSGVTGNIQNQLNNLITVSVPLRELNKTYKTGDIVKIPACSIFQYLEAICDGTTTDSNLNQQTSPIITGEVIEESEILWLCCDIRDGNQVGQIIDHIYIPTFTNLLKGYLNLCTGTSIFSMLYTPSTNYKFLRLIPFIINHLVTGDYVSTNTATGDRLFELLATGLVSIRDDIDDSLYSSDISNQISVFKNSTFKIKLWMIIGLMNWWRLHPLDFMNIAPDETVFNDIEFMQLCTNIFESPTGYKEEKQKFLLDVINDCYTKSINGSCSCSISIFERDLYDIFIKLGRVGNIGTIGKAGLPNIIGTIGHSDCSFGTYNPTRDDAFYTIKSTSSKPYQLAREARDNFIGDIGFNALRSNSIYGNSSTVTPKNLSVAKYIKY